MNRAFKLRLPGSEDGGFQGLAPRRKLGELLWRVTAVFKQLVVVRGKGVGKSVLVMIGSGTQRQRWFICFKVDYDRFLH